jgi:hypothetical protein
LRRKDERQIVKKKIESRISKEQRQKKNKEE